MTLSIKKSEPYSSLAEIYDSVMQDVDYEAWADYIDEIIMHHHPEARDLLELACGTGTMALSLEELGFFNITATDGAPEMIKTAKKKAADINSEVDFRVIDFLNISLDKTFDVIFMVFDSVNYLHKTEEIEQLFRQVSTVLKPKGIFIFDFTTPRNSRQAIKVLNNNSRRVNDYTRFHRESSYNAKDRIHTNRFHIEKKDADGSGKREMIEETHHQKIYTLEEMRDITKNSDFSLLGAYDGFELKPAHEKSLRITMVLQ
jgi:ubiquinone/menaquinone biosynthesis C-methylase UbiE